MADGQPIGAAARLLDAAEALFASADPDQVSTRQITAAAGCNPGAINYHFGSKDGLFDAVLARRLGHLAAERYDRIAELHARPSSPSADELVGIIAEPLITLVHDDPAQGPEWVRLIARLWLTRRSVVDRRAELTFDANAMAGLARRMLSHIDPDEAALRWQLAVDVLLMTLGDPFGNFADVAFDDRASTAVAAAVAVLNDDRDGSFGRAHGVSRR